jgi:hypothetical protein
VASPLMKCKTCGEEMITKSRLRLFIVGVVLVASVAAAFFVPYLWVPSILFLLIGGYLIVWATLGKGSWCRTCKRFSIS